MRSIGETIASERKRQGMCLGNLRLLSGITEESLSEIESGSRHPREDEVDAIAAALLVETEDLTRGVPGDHRANHGDR